MVDPQKPTLGKMKWLLFLLSHFKIPMIGFVRPKLLFIDDDQVKVRIKLRRRTKNHLNSMYFGSLAVGADIAGGIHTFYHAGTIPDKKLSFAFKSMNSEFLKRAETDIIFECKEGGKIKQAIIDSSHSAERKNIQVIVTASDLKGEIVATFDMGVSVKMI